jgi:hypothetical protein
MRAIGVETAVAHGCYVNVEGKLCVTVAQRKKSGRNQEEDKGGQRELSSYAGKEIQVYVSVLLPSDRRE